ncbi:MAG: hypothetical protein AB1453_05250 [Chloroflexota bacterium]|jgi:hypothetical protein
MIARQFDRLSPGARNWLVPGIILALYGLAFGWFLPHLGFYLDDWPHLYYHKLGGEEATRLFHAYDGRPLLSWFYVLSAQLFGFEPLPRQLFSLGLRFVTVLLAWVSLRMLWPKATWQVDTSAILFAVYPIFAQQPIAVSFSSHWAASLCLMASTFLMLAAIRSKKWFVPLTIAGVALSATSFTLSEYFYSLEMLRPVLLWFLAINLSLRGRERLLFVARHASPYLVVWGGFIVWRLFFINLPTADRIEPVILRQVFEQPVPTILQLTSWAAQDFMTNIITAWHKTFTTDMFDIQSRSNLIFLAMSLASWLLVGFYLFWLQRRDEENEGSQWWPQGLVIGLLYTFVAPLPAWLTGRSASESIGPMSDRLSMAAMFGAAILLTAMMEAVISKPRMRCVGLALLIGLATGWQARNSNDFRWSWTFQTRFFHQLALRVPSLQSGTLLASEQEFLPKVGVYPLSYAINLLYPKTTTTDQFEYYYVNLGRDYLKNIEDFSRGERYERRRWQSQFIGNTNAAIVIEYRPEDQTCLWVVDEADYLNPLLPERTRDALPASDLSRISLDRAEGYPFTDVFGSLAADSWCAYYQQASLAAQFQDWDAVVRLWAESEPFHHQVNAAVEFTPFIAGFIHSGDLDKAMLVSELIDQGVPGGAKPYLCSIWQRNLVKDQYNLALTKLEKLHCDLEINR